jgi:type IV secretory pathway TrbD component
MHASAVDGLHGKWWIAGEAIVILNGRLVVVVGIVCSIWTPARVLVVERVVVEMVVVIHLQLAHVERWGQQGMECGIRARAWKQASVLYEDQRQMADRHMHLDGGGSGGGAGCIYQSGVGAVRMVDGMHA